MRGEWGSWSTFRLSFGAQARGGGLLLRFPMVSPSSVRQSRSNRIFIPATRGPQEEKAG
jgi:hypothetical protein